MGMVKSHKNWGKNDDNDEDIQTLMIVKVTLTYNLVNGIGPVPRNAKPNGALVGQGIILYYLKALPLLVIKSFKQCERSRSKESDC